ncbi:unnamed protein product [Lathyrus oleraceus]|nr:uncharacterized protein LOC127132764 [Pisum sativum]XP_050917659.1 uncharacterized protein LOC127132764 [Pisum sativum]
MSSSEEKQIDTRDFRYVYVRRRRRNAAGSGKVVRDLDLNAPPPSEPSMPKTDGSFEIGDDSPLSPAPNLFQKAVTITRRKRSTLNRIPRSNLQPPSPPSIQVSKQSHMFRRNVDNDHSHQLSTPSTDITAFSPPPPSAEASASGKEWRCPTCLRIDNDELSKPLIYLKKQLKLKKGIKKSEG